MLQEKDWSKCRIEKVCHQAMIVGANKAAENQGLVSLVIFPFPFTDVVPFWGAISAPGEGVPWHGKSQGRKWKTKVINL